MSEVTVRKQSKRGISNSASFALCVRFYALAVTLLWKALFLTVHDNVCIPDSVTLRTGNKKGTC